MRAALRRWAAEKVARDLAAPLCVILHRENGVYYAYRRAGRLAWRFAVASTAHEAVRLVLPPWVSPADAVIR